MKTPQIFVLTKGNLLVDLRCAYDTLNDAAQEFQLAADTLKEDIANYPALQGTKDGELAQDIANKLEAFAQYLHAAEVKLPPVA